MNESLRGIVLHTVKYNEKNAVVRVYTDAHGIMSFLLPQSAGKVARMRRALFRELSLLEITTAITPNRDIFRIIDARVSEPLPMLYTNPVKNAIALFLTELLSRVIVEQEPNAPLFSYIWSAIKLLDALDDGIANFHICFLWNLGVFLGIEPDASTYSKGYAFDMVNGVFIHGLPAHSHFVTGDEAEEVYRLSRMTFENMHHYRFSRAQRNRVLDLSLEYLSIHNSSLGNLRSPEILRALFD